LQELLGHSDIKTAQIYSCASDISKFSQADSSDTRAKGEPDFGLAIINELVEKMGGTVDFDSVEG